MIRSFFIALQFMTIAPVTISGAVAKEDVGRSIIFYPLIGLLIGAFLVLVAKLMGDVQSTLVASAIILALWVIATGALHLDGLADCADGWMAGLGDSEKTLEVLKDPRSGPIAVVTLIIVLLLKFSAIAAVIENESYFALLLIPALARIAPAILFSTTPYVRPGGLGESLKEHYPKRLGNGSIWVTVIFALLLLGITGLKMLVAMAILLFILRTSAINRIGGITGDVVGAAIELCEVFAIVVVALSN